MKLLRKQRLVHRMERHGIVVPRIAYEEARRAGLELAVLCAVLEQESGGGKNVWGHDRGSDGQRIGPPHGGWHQGEEVTRLAYSTYRNWRDLRGRPPYGRMQGVGPMQLTWYSYQDEADELGGAWRPRYNVRVGAQLLARMVKRSGLHRALWSYNGSESYADEVEERVARWRRILK